MNVMTGTGMRGGCGCGGACSCGGTGNGSCGSVCQTDTAIRPLFFAGQLLTEDDLQSLEDYVVAKNRLHNRHLFGSGVVCGLAVVCDPCGTGHIWVQPGYALDCCGNDLTLDCRTKLDVNAMIRDLLRDERGGIDCGDPCVDQANSHYATKGKPPVREYCLTVQYCEQRSDPVSPYAVDAPCSPQACEPSRLREGLRFALRCPSKPGAPDDFFAALRHFFGDVIKLEKIGAEGVLGLERQVRGELAKLRHRGFEELKILLLDLIERSPHPTACTLFERVSAMRAPEPPKPRGQEDPVEQPGVEGLMDVFLELLRECFCMAILPPCPPCDDLAVEIACIRVQGCEVIEICNMSRQLVLSPASMRYWLGFGRLEAELRRICCPDDDCPPRPRVPPMEDVPGQRREAPMAERPVPVLPGRGLVRAGLVVEDLVRSLALTLPDDHPEAGRLDHLADLVGHLLGRAPERPDLQDKVSELRKEVERLRTLVETLTPGPKRGRTP
jgi:hypothetical protein